jgi:soluble cytochrome b562
MKIRLLALLALASVFAIGPVLHAQPPEGGADAPAAKGGKKKDREDTELEKKMSKMNGAFRKLRKQVADPASNASSLELVATMQAAGDDATKLIPDKAKDLPEADRPKFISSYQEKMKSFQGELVKLVALLKDNKNEDAAKLVTALVQLEKDDHKEFRRPQS